MSLLRTVVERFRTNILLTHASAIAFQLLVALIPLAGLALILIGLTGSEHLWHESVRPRLSERLETPVFLALNGIGERVIAETSLLWLGLGTAITLWQVSGSVRAVMGALNRIYGAEERRSMPRRFALSFALAAGVIALVLGALGLVALGGRVFWPAAVVLLWLTVMLLVRLGPVERRPFRWVGVGSTLVIVGWVGFSLAFGLYVRDFASFEGPFGFVAAALVLTGYLYFSSIVFLLGVQVDELLATAGTGSARSRRGSRRRRAPRRRRPSTASSGRGRGA